jgi:hypothetical protein
MARAELRVGAAADDRQMDSMILVLQPDEKQQAELASLLAEQHDPASPNYQQWLTPEEFGARFGVSDNDLTQVTRWLESNGLTVEEVTPGRRTVIFSGKAGQVRRAFRTQIGRYEVDGETHYANDGDVEIPAALAGVVHGVASLHDFRMTPMHAVRSREGIAPEFTSGSSHYLSPADFATIYDATALYGAGVDGTGQSLAVVARSNIKMTDVTSFRSRMGLPVNNPVVVLNGADPGVLGGGESTEALLDVEWAGAVASKATVQFVVSASTRSSDGVSLSAQYIVARNLAPVMSISFGSCEAALGTSGNQFWNNLFQQAAAQGITVLVSSGDSGAAGCDAAGASRGTHARGINALCSSPNSVCVGGTQFNDTAAPPLYWSATTNSANGASALSYIPEVVWNESGTAGGSGLWSTGGGASIIYPKPAWQTGPGVPADGHRDVPDVSLSAAGHDGYLIVQDGGLSAVGGTSASAPALASVMALVAQKNGARLGNPNPNFYALAARQAQGGAAVFHDIKAGNNSVPGVEGYAAGPGYDLATGLGSVDVYQLVNNWKSITAAPGFTINVPAAVPLLVGSTAAAAVSVSLTGAFSSSMVLTAGGLPSGLTAKFAPATLPAPGSGSSVLTLTGAKTLAAGTYQVVVTATGGGQAKTAVVGVTVSAPVVTLAVPAAVTVTAGAQANAGVTVTGTLLSSMKVSASGLPSGVTAAFTPSSVPAGINGQSNLVFTAAKTATSGSYTIAVLLSGGGVTKSATLLLTVFPAPQVFAATLSPASLTIRRGSAAGKAVLAITPATGSASVQVSVSGVPANVTPLLQVTSVTLSSWQVSLSLTASSAAKVGSSTVVLLVTNGTATKSAPLQLTVR